MQGKVSARRVRMQADRTFVPGELGLTPMYASRRVSLSPDDRLALWVSGGAAMLFLLACLNVAGLLWTHALERSREIAVCDCSSARAGPVFWRSFWPST